MTKCKQLLTDISQHKYDSVFQKLYGYDKAVISYQQKRYLDAISRFSSLFHDDMVEIFSAPGRTEICGNHTDHQHGQVLAASINLDAIAVVCKNPLPEIEFISEGYSPVVIHIDNPDPVPEETGTTAALIRGVLKGFLNMGYKIGGFKAYVTSDVLSGSGLSSSAALESIIGIILSGLYNNMAVSLIDIAIIGQYAENVYFGKPCGLMDQIACSVGDFVHINFANASEPSIEKIDYDIKKYGYTLCIVDTKGSHADLTDDYASIPAEMKQIANYFGKEYLNEVTFDEFIQNFSHLEQLGNTRALLRAFHFITENQRVEKAARSLQDKNINAFLNVIKQSGDSSYKYLQNVYTNKDILSQPIPLALALTEDFLQSEGVCRVHGGGFAGTIQVFLPTEMAEEYKTYIESFLGPNTCHILSIRKIGATKVL